MGKISCNNFGINTGTLTMSSSCVLITGASSGIGASLALALADLNCTLHLASRSVERLNQIAECVEKRVRQRSLFTAVISVMRLHLWCLPQKLMNRLMCWSIVLGWVYWIVVLGEIFLILL